MALTGKRALVTGASRGIGASIAETLAAEGADVAITYAPCPTSWRQHMNSILSPIILIATLGLCSAETLDQSSLNPTSTFTTEYPALHAFHHTVGETSYVGYYFNSRKANCSVLIWSQPANEKPADKTTHQQVRIDLNAKQAITFFADSRGSNLSLECAADAKSLLVSQTSVPFTQ